MKKCALTRVESSWSAFRQSSTTDAHWPSWRWHNARFVKKADSLGLLACMEKKWPEPSIKNLNLGSLVPRPFPPPVFDHLLYANMNTEVEGLGYLAGGCNSHRLYSHSCDRGSKLWPALFGSLTVDHANFLAIDLWPLGYFACKEVSIFELQPKSTSLYVRK